MKKILLSGLMGVASFTSMAQSLEKMQWFNEPAQWEIKGDLLSMNVPKLITGAYLTMVLL